MDKSQYPLPKRLKQARLTVGLSQRELGIKAGIDEFSSSARMNQYETGKHVPDYLMLHNIAKAINYPVPYFYADNDLMAEIILKCHKLSKAQRTDLLSYITNS